MNETITPHAEDEVAAAIRWAAAAGAKLEVIGAGTKRALGRPVDSDATLDLSRLAGIDFYEPEELVIAARPGTPLEEVRATLAAQNQMLAFDPPALGALFNAPAGGETLGGVIACNLAGPRRVKAGAARDHVLGVHAVSGRGEIFKSGGRVVKNVTGYDLPKLLTGSYGTLAAFTRIVLKVAPAPETETTLLLRNLGDAAGQDAMAAALASPHEVSAAAHLPAPSVARFASLGAEATTALRLEGFAPSVSARTESLSALLGPFGEIERLAEEQSARLWRWIRDVGPFQTNPRPIWRLSLTPNAAPGAVASIIARAGGEAFYDWGGGLVWLALDEVRDAVVRAATASAGGHATLIRAPEEVRAKSAVFHPQPAALDALNARIKHAFDPKGVLNPGRMAANR